MIKVQIKASELKKESKFAISNKTEIELNDFSEIIKYVTENNYKFEKFKLLSENLELTEVSQDTDLTGQFVTTDGINFEMVTNMIIGKELGALNHDSKKWERENSIGVWLSNHCWTRVSKLKKISIDNYLCTDLTNVYIGNRNSEPYSIEIKRRKTATFTGHRPKRLGGYNMKNPTMLKLKEKLLIVIEDLIINKGITDFISGGALGADQAAFWCVQILKKKYPYIRNIVAVPYEDQPNKWSDEQKYWYFKMLNLADEVVFVDRIQEYQRDERTKVDRWSNYKLQIRNEYMIDHAEYVIAIYDGVAIGNDGKTSGTYNCLKYAFYYERPILRLDPDNDFKVEINYKISA